VTFAEIDVGQLRIDSRRCGGVRQAEVGVARTLEQRARLCGLVGNEGGAAGAVGELGLRARIVCQLGGLLVVPLRLCGGTRRASRTGQARRPAPEGRGSIALPGRFA